MALVITQRDLFIDATLTVTAVGDAGNVTFAFPSYFLGMIYEKPERV
jgi:hypothetical protein